ncbi:acetolactate synthase large subunit [Pseudooceanicola nanhaiensis]|uniref:acetolactate synthase large subunit n=1 Tax=Pseudooceanicola nanhaiensis TaxID=375761 RepID=UPI001CD674F8|nr:acetolactate synthase large subunit [Pseudooceanicola nanhaiensis]MCA0919798.1 acetolactate synthase large subunit [Pseudooceanicola nanhaiensis]
MTIGADLLCETLLANGIDTCFANPGTSEMHFVAALDRQPRMRCVLGLFEGVVTGAADGYARMAEKPAATLLHLGPGLANGLANVHNAKRANTPMVNVVGDHATYHLALDAPLTSDIDSLAAPMSHWVGRADSPDTVVDRTEEAIAEAMTAPGRIATLILHADASWGAAQQAVPAALIPPAPLPPEAAQIRAAAQALRNGKSTTIIISGKALRAEQQAVLDRIARKTGARLIAQQSNGRMERGAGRPLLDRVPYKIELALKTFAETEQVILISAKSPVGFFAYPGQPGDMLPEGCTVIDMATGAHDVPAAIAALADEVGLADAPAAQLAARGAPDMPTGALTPDVIAIALARHMPDHAIICDESVSSGRDFFRTTYGAAPHDFLQLTGGAIGLGLPMATGAAVACPDRKVISLQADGSGMYTVQALWTQARERLDVVTIVFANRRYNILHGELKGVGAGDPGENARKMLDLDDPALNWVQMANGMGVEAARADTAEGFADLLSAALSRPGPFLIEAMI